LIDPAVQQACSDNLDIACKLVEKAAMEKGVLEMDEHHIGAAIQARKKHRERGTTQPFYDMQYFSGRYPAALPEPLRPRPGGLQPYQVRCSAAIIDCSVSSVAAVRFTVIASDV
jgi:CCR4-NOT transcription complex subunit 1